MKYISREFSPAEAAELTGVSVTLQRDWRRRGILPENPNGKWTRFTLTDAIRLTVMKIVSDAGFAVSKTSDVVGMAILPTLAELQMLPDVYAFEGDPISDRLMEMAVTGNVGGADGRYLVMVNAPNGETLVRRCRDFGQAESIIDDANSVQCFIIDCCRLAWLIRDRLSGPIIRVEVEVTPDD